jgi:hypothetical protein
VADWAGTFFERLIYDPQTLATVILAGLTFSYVRLTFEQTGAIRVSAKAAEKSALIAERAMTELESAYVFVAIEHAGPNPGEPIIASNSPGQISLLYDFPILVRLYNHGKSPAILRGLRAHSATAESPPQELMVVSEAQIRLPDGLVVGPDKPLDRTIDHRMTLEEWGSVVAGIQRIYCYGLIEYSDVLGSRRETGFCWHFERHEIRKEFFISQGTPLNYRT